MQKERGSMAGLKSILREEKKRLEDLMEKSICQMKNLPEGTLRVSVDKGYPRYYRCLEGDKVGNYIRKQDKERLPRSWRKRNTIPKYCSLYRKG